MNKKTFKLTLEVTYDVCMDSAQEFYGTTDPEEMLAIDVANYNDDPYLLFEGDDINFKVTGEVVN